MSAKRVVIIYASAGMGHLKASIAIEEAFSVHHPDIQVTRLDILDYVSPLWRKILRDGYNYISSRRPWLWKWFYNHYNTDGNQHTLDWLSRVAVHKTFLAAVAAAQPDVIINTHPLPVKILADVTEGQLAHIPLYTLITDYGCHSYWIHDGVAGYFVASPAVVDSLREVGVSADKIQLTGIPIEQKFLKPVDRTTIAKHLGIDLKKTTLLIVGGQFGLAVLEQIIAGITAEHPELQYVVVAGRDEALQHALETSALRQNPLVHVFGFIDNMEEVMSVADLTFSKAGGLTVSECLAKGLPMIINKVIPGQEDDNVAFLVDHGAGIRVTTIEEIPSVVNNLLRQPETLENMRTACAALGRPQAANDIAAAIAKL